MLLREWSWDDQNYIEVEYPDELIKKFVDQLRMNKQWWQSPDPGRDVYEAYFRPFQQQLVDHRQRVREAAPASSESVAERAARVRAARTAGLAKARAVQAAERARAAPSG